MLLDSLAPAFFLADVILLIRTMKKYKKLLKLYEYLTQTQQLNVKEAIKLLENKQIGSSFPIIVRGLIRAKPTSLDNNILSVISATPINKPDRLKQYIFERIPYREVLANAFWIRPPPSNISFDLHDLNSSTSIPVACGQNTDISGILTETKVFSAENENLANPLISRLKSILNHIMFLSPFKFSQKVGEKITYHNIMNDQFGYVIGQAKKGADGQMKIENPSFISKQLAFVVNRLKQNLRIHRYALLIYLLLLVFILYYLGKWIHRRSGWDINFLTQRIEKPEQDIPANQTCIVCYSAARSVIFKPCKHYGVCLSCYKHIGVQKSCPLCKQKIEGIIQIIKKN